MRFRRALACLGLVFAAGCAGPTSPSDMPNMTGTWKGLVTSPAEAAGIPVYFWLTQDGQTVTGTWGGVDEIYTKPPISGTVDGNVFTFIARSGRTVCGESPGTATFSGRNLQVMIEGSTTGPENCGRSKITWTAQKVSDDPTFENNDPNLRRPSGD